MSEPAYPDWWGTVKYFKPAEFACKCSACRSSSALAPMDEYFVLKLDVLREKLGRPLMITSGYRCPAHNSAVSTTGPSGPHTTGKAADVHVYGAEAYRLVREAMLLGFVGIGVNQKGDYLGRFIHLDTLPTTDSKRPALWTY